MSKILLKKSCLIGLLVLNSVAAQAGGNDNNIHTIFENENPNKILPKPKNIIVDDCNENKKIKQSIDKGRKVNIEGESSWLSYCFGWLKFKITVIEKNKEKNKEEKTTVTHSSTTNTSSSQNLRSSFPNPNKVVPFTGKGYTTGGKNIVGRSFEEELQLAMEESSIEYAQKLSPKKN